MGDTCMPMKTGDCWNMCPMTCLATDVLCTPPPDANGCDMGSFCMPAAEGCPIEPIECPEPPLPVERNWETDMSCPSMDANGCHMGDTCMPMKTGDCWNMCPMTCL